MPARTPMFIAFAAFTAAAACAGAAQPDLSMIGFDDISSNATLAAEPQDSSAIPLEASHGAFGESAFRNPTLGASIDSWSSAGDNTIAFCEDTFSDRSLPAPGTLLTLAAAPLFARRRR